MSADGPSQNTAGLNLRGFYGYEAVLISIIYTEV